MHRVSVVGLLVMMASTALADVCRVYRAGVMYSVDGSDTTTDADFLECAFVTATGESDEFAVLDGVPDSVMTENAHRLFKGEWFLEYDPAWLQPGLPPTLVAPEGSSFRTIEPNDVPRKLSHVRRKLPEDFYVYGPADDSPTKGVVVVVRVTTADRSPNTTAAQIEEAIFGATDSFASQLSTCSFGKETIRPYNASKPVLEVTVEASAADLTFNGLFLAANPLVKDCYGVDRLDEIAQFAVFVGPTGLGTNLPGLATAEMIAYGGLQHFKSVFADDVILTPQVLLHETGHNRNLGHTWEGTEEYQDNSSVMGSLWRTTVHQCNNGLDYAHLGWMSDRSVQVDLSQGPQVYDLAFFGDYPQTDETQPTILQVEGLFLQYNRRKGINRETREHADKLVVHQLKRPSTTSEGSQLVVALDDADHRDWVSGDVRLHVCGKIEGGAASDVDVLQVSVGGVYDNLELACLQHSVQSRIDANPAASKPLVIVMPTSRPGESTGVSTTNSVTNPPCIQTGIGWADNIFRRVLPPCEGDHDA